MRQRPTPSVPALPLRCCVWFAVLLLAAVPRALRADEPASEPGPVGAGAPAALASDVQQASAPDPRSLLTDLRVGLAFQDRLRRSTLGAEGVVRVFEQLLQSSPENEILRFLGARARGTKADCALMRAALERRLGLPATEREQVGAGWFALARCQADRKLLSEALESAAFALRLVPGERTWALLGWIHQQRGDDAQAIGAYVEALRIDARPLTTRLALTDLLLKADRVDDALRLAKGTLMLEPRSALGQLYWGTALCLAGSTADGRRAYQRALRLADGDPDQVAAVAGALRRIDGQALAYEPLLAAHRAEPQHRGVLTQLVGIQLETARADQAAALLDEALRRDQADGPLWFLRGLAYDALKDPKGAAVAYQRASRLDPERLDYRLAQGAALTRAGDGRAAVNVYGAAAQRFKDDARARELYARSLLEQRQFTEAAQQFEELAKLAPRDPNPCYFVAVVRGVHLGQGREAREWLERYSALGGAEPAALRWLEDLKRTGG